MNILENKKAFFLSFREVLSIIHGLLKQKNHYFAFAISKMVSG
jgi:hypothetical protein